MNLFTSIDWTELSIQWMVTCGHFLWQGIVVAAIFLVLEQLTRAGSFRGKMTLERGSNHPSPKRTEYPTSASLRYGLACVSLLSLPVCVLLTFLMVHNARGTVLKTTTPSIGNAMDLNGSQPAKVTTIEREPSLVPTGNGNAFPTVSDLERNRARLPPATKDAVSSGSVRTSFLAPLLAACYAIVVGLLLFRIHLSLLGSLQFRNVAQPITDPSHLRLVLTQATRLKLKVVPIVALCTRVSSPVVVGIVQPMILLPPSLFYGLDPTQFAAILSHEMAHIRRFDLFFNLVQRIVESLLFFHPVTWWLSRRVTIERENCCDDVAASLVGRFTYAEALVRMAGICLANHRSRSQALTTLAADGGNSTDFGYRVRRLIDAQETPQILLSKRNISFCIATVASIGASLVALAQCPPIMNDHAHWNQPAKESLLDGIQWSTWGDRDGLLSGARLILPEGGVHPGQPVVVEYRLKNVSSVTKKFACYVRGNWQYITLESQNRIRDMGIDTADQPIEISLEAGKEYIASLHTAKIDTRGLLPGEYQVALGSAFYCPDLDHAGVKHEIPHRGSLPLIILGEPNATPPRPLDQSIHWGDAIAGLKLGAKFHGPASKIALGGTVEADLLIANVTNQAIECSIRLPHPMDGWLLNVKNHLGETIMLERPPFVSIYSRQEFFSLKLAPGEARALTGDRIEGQPAAFAGRSAKFEIVSEKEDQGSGDPLIKERLVTQGGNFSVTYNITIERPDIPGLRIELDTGNCPFTVGPPHVDPLAARMLDEATDNSILWGESVAGMRLGIRQSQFAQRRTVLRHGEHIDYEVWIKNETDQLVRIARDPGVHYEPRLQDDGSIDLAGWSVEGSFYIPQEEFTKAELILPPGHAALRFLSPQQSASIRPPDSPRGRFGNEPLHLKPGKYPVYAQVDGLKSGVEEVEIIPAAHLQIRKSSQVTEKKREYAAKDPSEAILVWQSIDGAKQEAMINWDLGIFIDERDLASVDVIAAEGRSDLYSIALKLRPESASWLSRRIAMYSLWDDPDMVAILLDGKPLGALRIPSPIPADTLIIPVGLSLKQANSIIQEIQAAMANPAPPKAAPPAGKTGLKPQGTKFVGDAR